MKSFRLKILFNILCIVGIAASFVLVNGEETFAYIFAACLLSVIYVNKL